MAARRTTLGNLSSSTINVRNGGRTSLGPPLVSTSVADSKLQGKRFSIAVDGSIANRRNSSLTVNKKLSTGSKRSTTYGRGAIRNDPRPVNDKKYMNASIRTLLNFLTDYGYDYAISPKLLTRPTGKDFNNIVQFLFRKIDPNFCFGGKIEDDIISMFKTLRYPFGISKTSLSAVGSPHTWPALLASITWLIELLQYDAEVFGKNGPGVDINVDIDQREFVEYLGQAYQAFLMGDDDLYSQLEEQLAASFHESHEAMNKEIDELQQKNEQLVKTLDRLEERKSLLPKLEESKTNFEKDMEKFKMYIQQLEEHHDITQEKVRQREEEIVKIDEEITAVRNQVLELRQRINSQEISMEDVQRMTKHRKRLEECIRETRQSKKESEEKLWNLELEVSERYNQIEEEAHNFNKDVARLRMYEESSKSFSCMAEIKTDKENIQSSKPVFGTNLNASLKPELRRVRDQRKTAAQRCREEVKGERRRVLDAYVTQERSEEELAELLEQREIFEADFRRKEEEYKTTKQMMDSSLMNLQDAREEIHRRLEEEQIKDPLQVDRARRESMDEIQGLKKRNARNQQEYERIQTSLHRMLVDVLRVCTEHKSLVQEEVAEISEYVDQALAYATNIRYPAT